MRIRNARCVSCRYLGNPRCSRDLVGRYIDWLEAQDEPTDAKWTSDVAWTAAIGRSHFDHRAGIVHSDTAELVKGLRNVIGNLDDDDQLETNLAKRVAFAYSDTADWTSTTAKALYETEPAFRTVLDRCDTAVNSEQSLIDNFLDSAGNTPLNLPTTYALDCALTALWQSLGIRPQRRICPWFRRIGSRASSRHDLVRRWFPIGNITARTRRCTKGQWFIRSRICQPRISLPRSQPVRLDCATHQHCNR